MIITRAFGSASRAAAAIAATALIVSAAIPASATPDRDPPKPNAQSSDQQQSAKPKLYCAARPVTGTMLPARICKTREQWIAATGVDPAAPRQ